MKNFILNKLGILKCKRRVKFKFSFLIFTSIFALQVKTKIGWITISSIAVCKVGGYRPFAIKRVLEDKVWVPENNNFLNYKGEFSSPYYKRLEKSINKN